MAEPSVKSIVTKDGIEITGIPIDMPKDDQRLKNQVAQMRAAGIKSGTFAGTKPTGDMAKEASALEAASRQTQPQAGQTAFSGKQTPGELAGQIISEIPQNAGLAARGLVKGAMSIPTMVMDPVTAFMNKYLPPEWQQLPPSEGITLMFKSLGVKEPETRAQEVLESLTRGIGAGAAGIGVGTALAAGAPAIGMGTAAQEIGKTLATGPLQQIAGSVGAEGGSTLARQQGAGPLMQFGAGMAGGVAGAGLGNVMSLKPTGVHPMQSTVDASEKLNTQLMTSDVLPPKTFAAKTGQAIGEKIPVIGTGPIRAKQQADRIKDVKDLLRQFGADDAAAASDDVMDDLLTKRSGNIERWKGMKDKVINELSDRTSMEKKDIPSGWYVHGRSEGKDFANDDWPTQFTNKIEVAEAYAGDTGEVWIARPSKDARVIKMSENSPDMEDLVSIVQKNFEDGGDQTAHIRNAIENYTDMDDVNAVNDAISDYVRSNFAPENIVDSAQAYDDMQDLDLLSLLPGGYPDWVETPDGAILIPGSKAFEAKNISGPQSVPMPVTTTKIDDSIAKLKSLKTAEVAPVIAKLEDWKQAIQGQDLKNIELLRKQIGETFTAPEMAAVRSTGERVLSDIYGAVKQDMTEYIAKEGGQQALNKWQVANKELSKMMGDLDLDILKNTLEKGVDRPEVVKNMLFNKDRSVIQALNKNLTAKGRESARAAVMQEVSKKIGEEASPERFLTELRKMKSGGDPVGVFFTGDDLKAVEGLTRVLKATSRASQAALNPPTGVQAVIPLSIIGLSGGSVALEKYFGQGLPGLLASAGIAGAAGAGARLYESSAVRNILMKLPTVRPGSVEEAALFKRLLEAAQAVKPKEEYER